MNQEVNYNIDMDIEIPDEEQQEQEMYYREIYSAVVLNQEITITIFADAVEPTKTGIKNHKARLNAELKAENLPADDSTLTFAEEESKKYPGCIELTIFLKKKASVRVFEVKIPKDEDKLPD